MPRNSLKINSVLNMIRSLTKIIFPLITYKYVAGILQVENLGRYSFATSIVIYFTFISALGVNAYSIRTGVAYRDNKEQLEKFVEEIFTINLISTLIAYFLMGIVLVSAQNLKEYRELIIILGLQIFFTTFGIEWLYSIMEDYLYITIRTILFQIVALLLLFLYVKSINDTNRYAFITVIATVGSNVLNYIHAKKYCKVKITIKPNIKKHIVPILIIFAQNISVLIYVNSDITMLGILSGNYYVGLYSIATNIYKGIKTILSALIIVSIPRLSYYIGKHEFDNFELTLQKIFITLMTFIFPIIVGVIFLGKEIVLLLSNSNYIEATASVQLLSIATLFCILSYIYGQCILIPMQKESILLRATLVSALLNIGMNIILIPFLKQNGAAITTIISEVIVFVICWKSVHNDIKICKSFENILKPMVGSIGVAAICLLTKCIVSSIFPRLIISVVLSTVIYFLIEIMLKNELILEFDLKLKWIRKEEF
ncbi:flippase [Enterocloster citroniae]|uniref:flippase n=1 Tax=Enterocloster citroniae TaxID=358743 RepID=UPI0008EE5518|nr:flippase [Enterocloster citroniae]SFR95512.1 Membrane protein involved in the export of O-antigen and teichoic acid [Enterocloster citroniae]